MATVVLKLFVAGDSARARAAQASLLRLSSERLGGDARIETIDILAHPDEAEAYRILTTPTVVRETPPPRRRVTGDLGDADGVLDALALHLELNDR